MGRSIGVILAGGSGTRVGGEMPKQLLPLAGKPLMEHSVAAFQASGIDEIVIVMQADHLAEAEAIASKYPKVTAVLPGGPSRTASTLAALKHLAGAAPDTKVLVHDAARPLVTPQIVDAVLTALDTFEAVSVTVPSADTVFEVDGRLVAAVPERWRLRRVQTPQGFRLGVIMLAYRQAADDPAFDGATDDCSVVFNYLPGVPVAAIDGAESNIKVTSASDMALAGRLLQWQEPNQQSHE